jgi:hypothetical protein
MPFHGPACYFKASARSPPVQAAFSEPALRWPQLDSSGVAMKRHIAAVAIVLAALGIAGQVQAQGWSNDRHSSGNDRHDQRSDHRSWNGDRRGGESGRPSWRDQGHSQWRGQSRDQWRGSWRDQWRDGHRNRYWSEPRGWRDEGRYWQPRYRYNDYYYDPIYGYGYDYDGDISLLISLPLQY